MTENKNLPLNLGKKKLSVEHRETSTSMACSYLSNESHGHAVMVPLIDGELCPFLFFSCRFPFFFLWGLVDLLCPNQSIMHPKTNCTASTGFNTFFSMKK